MHTKIYIKQTLGRTADLKLIDLWWLLFARP